eukprot:CAMPEP_0119466858 /NCGR_PEP_ID=MMETSP1344-20130328/1318_1 /TAXON_ID=236787 /ORGANISM="Florenciella parvula, Strain CCMP2471" /LENGTH=116 /DNA_ID=CAMNT_0007499193 /DNA_START=1643 /DNA_END=1993 /DNA_ORIENTATION=-
MASMQVPAWSVSAWCGRGALCSGALRVCALCGAATGDFAGGGVRFRGMGGVRSGALRVGALCGAGTGDFAGGMRRAGGSFVVEGGLAIIGSNVRGWASWRAGFGELWRCGSVCEVL